MRGRVKDVAVKVWAGPLCCASTLARYLYVMWTTLFANETGGEETARTSFNKPRLFSRLICES